MRLTLFWGQCGALPCCLVAAQLESVGTRARTNILGVSAMGAAVTAYLACSASAA